MKTYSDKQFLVFLKDNEQMRLYEEAHVYTFGVYKVRNSNAIRETCRINKGLIEALVSKGIIVKDEEGFIKLIEREKLSELLTS